ncbi:MAG: hypothetical protein RLZZ297_1893 [Chloroflexota bacterium]|jgi:predicted membrane-bound mannosyltransferase
MTEKTPLRERFALTWEHGVFIIILALSVLTRFWGLGDRALHHDETLHADYSYSLYAGLGFVHDPLLHGPFLYIMGAISYFFFGDSDYTARFSPALYSVALGMTPFLLRRELGRTSAIIAAAVMLFSPVFLYIGRFFRHDSYAVLFEVLVLISIIRYARSTHPGWLILGAVAFSLMLTDLETAYLYLAIFLPVIAAVFFWQVWRKGLLVVGAIGVLVVASVFILPGKAQPADKPTEDITVTRAFGNYVCPSEPLDGYIDNPIVTAQPGPLFGFGALETADNTYALCVRHQPDNQLRVYLFKLWQFFSHPAILLGAAVALLGGAALYYLVWRLKDKTGLTAWERANQSPNTLVRAYASLGADNRFLKAVGLAFIPYALFFSSFFNNPVGVISGTTGSLLYWLAQHNVKRGGQPNHYYAVMLAIYEPLIVLAALASAVLVIVRTVKLIRSKENPSLQLAMGMLFAYWSFGAFMIFSWAGEKMPWLTIHPLTPLTFLAAWGAGQLFDAWLKEHRSKADGTSAAIAVGGMSAIVAFAAFTLQTMAIHPDSAFAYLAPWLPLAFVLICAVVALSHYKSHGALWSLGMLVFVLSGSLALYEFRSSWRINYITGDTADEMLVYTQTSPDALRAIRDVREASMRRFGDLSMPIWHDNETVWDWYLRPFTNHSEQPAGAPGVPTDDVMAIFVLDENLSSIDDNTLPGFLIQKYPLRWWFPEDQIYRLQEGWMSEPVNDNSSLLTKILLQPFDQGTAVRTWRFLLFRDTGAALGSSDFYLAIRPAIAPFMSLGLGAR